MKQIFTFMTVTGGLCRPLIPVTTIILMGLATATATVFSGFIVAATVAAAE